MKMSKSIKDYREAMDSVKISDSFYKRTETLLNELSEVKLEEKKPALSAGRITAGLFAAAACVLFVFGVRAARQTDNIEITTEESVSVTEVTGTDGETGTNTASPIIDDLDGGEGFEEDMEVGIAENSDEIEPNAAGQDTYETSVTTKTTEGTTASSETVTTANPTSGSGNNVTTSAPAPVQTPPPASGEGAAQQSETSETVPLFSDISYEYVTVEITPYFNMGTVKSGEKPVKLKGTDCEDIIEYIGVLTEDEKTVKMGNYSFSSLFSLQIADENMGLTFYSIYVTDNNMLVITRHEAGGQTRVTYGLNPDDYEALKHILFLQFGSEEDYELFKNLVSGK